MKRTSGSTRHPHIGIPVLAASIIDLVVDADQQVRALGTAGSSRSGSLICAMVPDSWRHHRHTCAQCHRRSW